MINLFLSSIRIILSSMTSVLLTDLADNWWFENKPLFRPHRLPTMCIVLWSDWLIAYGVSKHCETGFARVVTWYNVYELVIITLNLFNVWWNLSHNKTCHRFMTVRGVTRCNMSWNLFCNGVVTQVSQIVASCNISLNVVVSHGVIFMDTPTQETLLQMLTRVM